MDFITNNPTMLILSAMHYTKMKISGELIVVVIIITMFDILSKKMAHIENVSNSYTY